MQPTDENVIERRRRLNISAYRRWQQEEEIPVYSGSYVEDLLASNRLRPAFLFDAVTTRRVGPEQMTAADPDLRTLRNLNTREDYEQALAAAGF